MNEQREVVAWEVLLTVADVAKWLQVSRSWVYHRAESGELPCLRFGGHLRFKREEIERWLVARSDGPRGAAG